MATAYLREKTLGAAESLATGAGPIQDRLANAWLSYLDRLRIDPDQYFAGEPEARQTFERISGELRDRTDVRTGTTGLDDEAAVAVAHDVFALFAQVFGIP